MVEYNLKELEELSLEVIGDVINGINVGVAISDPNRPDEPLVYVNKGFEKLTGYFIKEIIGRNCRFLQGEKTDQETRKKIREAIKSHSEITVEILNYKKDGTEFWNELHIMPIFHQNGEVRFFAGIQHDVTERKRLELLHKNNLNYSRRMINSLLPSTNLDKEDFNISVAYKLVEEIGGDFYFYYRMQDRIGQKRYVVMIFDVMGHGIPASLAVMSIHTVLTSSVVTEKIEIIAEYMSKLFYKQFQNFDAPMYFTCCFAEINPSNQTLSYINAGNPSPFLIDRNGNVTNLESTLPPIGILEFSDVKTKELKYHVGDKLVLYTDGVVDLMDDDGNMTNNTSSFITKMKEKEHISNQDLLDMYDQYRENICDDFTIIAVEFVQSSDNH